jgi:hypothetical protein
MVSKVAGYISVKVDDLNQRDYDGSTIKELYKIIETLPILYTFLY